MGLMVGFMVVVVFLMPKLMENIGTLLLPFTCGCLLSMYYWFSSLNRFVGLALSSSNHCDNNQNKQFRYIGFLRTVVILVKQIQRKWREHKRSWETKECLHSLACCPLAAKESSSALIRSPRPTTSCMYRHNTSDEPLEEINVRKFLKRLGCQWWCFISAAFGFGLLLYVQRDSQADIKNCFLLTLSC